MDSDRLLEELKEVLLKCGISPEIRDLSDNEINVNSGLCEVETERRLIMDKRVSTGKMVDMILNVLESENLDGIYLPPAVRETVESRKK